MDIIINHGNRLFSSPVFQNVRNFSDVISPRSGAPVFYYNQGWKDVMYGRNGNAQAIELYRILKGLPTLILSLQEVDGQYSANVVFWGIADMVLPDNKTIFTISQSELTLAVLRAEADQKINRYNRNNVPLPKDHNIQIRLEELLRQEELKKRNASPEDIEEMLKDEYYDKYSIAGKENLISQERNKVLSAMLQIASAAFTDAYYLVTYNIAPWIPELCVKNPDFKHPQIMELFKNIFDSLLTNPAGDLLNTPLRYALVADAFRQIGFNEYASSYAKKCADILHNLMRNEKATFAPQHYEASRLLENCNVTVMLPKQIEAKPKKKLIAATGFDEKFLLAIPLGNGVTLEMIKVKAGFFMMGSPEYEKERSNDEKFHRVTLTKDYYLGKFPVTQAQWRAVMGYNPSCFEGDNRPVEDVSWNDAKEFCDELNKKYAGKLPKGCKFDLPTEAQWERACRAGTTTAYCWGDSM